MKSTPSSSERCRLLLTQWRANLSLSNRENEIFSGELINLDRQLQRLIEKHLRIAVFGKVGGGKSSLINQTLYPMLSTEYFQKNIYDDFD